MELPLNIDLLGNRKLQIELFAIPAQQSFYTLMHKPVSRLFLATLMIMVVLSSAEDCPKGHVLIKNQCISCTSLENVETNNVDLLTKPNSCPCIQGYFWSKVLQRCWPVIASPRSIKAYINESLAYQQDLQYSPRLLQTCDRNLGLVSYRSSCISCRLIPYSTGVALSSSACACTQSFSWISNTCQCGYLSYIDATTKTCVPCSALPSTTLLNACKACSTPFIRGANGCVNSKTLTINDSLSTVCPTGYRFDPILTACVCDITQQYAIAADKVCKPCLSTDSYCKSCVKNYFYDNFQCIHGSLIDNYDYNSTFACLPNHVLKTDPVTNRKLYCACDRTKGLYQHNFCYNCTFQLPEGVNSSQCSACASAQGFFQGPQECFFCPVVPYSTGSVSAAGCVCRTNYYWNNNFGRCECDWSRGYIGGAIDNCVKCQDLPNTAQTVQPNRCSCNRGYYWNENFRVCMCNTNSPSVFELQNVCIECSQMAGSTGEVTTNPPKGCVCISGFYWNPGTNKCQCDSTQSTVLSKGVCVDCSLAKLTTGIAYAGKCLCLRGHVWNADKMACVCPQGHAYSFGQCLTCQQVENQAGLPIKEDCRTCPQTNTWKKTTSGCLYCPYQRFTCNCPTGMTLIPQLGGCVCDWSKDYVTSVRGNSFICIKCPSTIPGTNICSCQNNYFASAAYDICTNCDSDPNKQIDPNTGVCSCKPGFFWSQDTYPFKCIRSTLGTHFISRRMQIQCRMLQTDALKAACAICDLSLGFVLSPVSRTCSYCGRLDPSSITGRALPSGCQCKDGYKWDPIEFECVSVSCNQGFILTPGTRNCDYCDLARSIIIDNVCKSCEAVMFSNGYAENSTACKCIPGYLFQINADTDQPQCKRLADSSYCNSANSLIIGGRCFKCPTNANSSGTATNGKCNCLNGNVWQFDNNGGGSCVCNPSLDGCQCANGYMWSTITRTCVCDSILDNSRGYLLDGTCYRCLRKFNPNFNQELADSGICECTYGFTAQRTATGQGTCVCLAPRTLVNGSCLDCKDGANMTVNVDWKGGCECKNNYIWSRELMGCFCDHRVGGILPEGSTRCFTCTTDNDPNFVAANIYNKCVCRNGWIFKATPHGGNCTCDDEFYIEGIYCSVCPGSDTTYRKSDGANGCLCKKNFVWSRQARTCICNATVNSIVLENGTCFTCGKDIDPNFSGFIVNNTCECINSYTTVIRPQTQLPYCACLGYIDRNGCNPCALKTGQRNQPGPNASCLCVGGYIWNATRKECICDSATSIQSSNPQMLCFRCGAAGTLTTTRKDAFSCNCVSPVLTWEYTNFSCNCGPNKVVVQSGNTFTCVPCDNTTNSAGTFNLTTCYCVNRELMWNSTTRRCDCGPNSILFRGTCIRCDDSTYSSGIAPSNGTAAPRCRCRLSTMTWNSDMGVCVCNSDSQVVFVGTNITCQTCGSVTNSLPGRRVTPFSCACPSGFTWRINRGCVCPGQDAALFFFPATASSPAIFTCITCDFSIYSSGPTADGRACACLGALTWQAAGRKCGCPTGSVIAVNNGTYSCVVCNSRIYANALTAQASQCTCISNALKWYPQGYCACPDVNSEIIMGSNATNIRCLACDASINAFGKAAPTSNNCTCISDVLTFNATAGSCNCPPNRVLIVQGATNFLCVPCSNASIYLGPRNATTGTCNCLSPNLVWDPSIGVCDCNNSLQIAVGTGAAAACFFCRGPYVTTPASFNGCRCLAIGMVFSASLSGVNATMTCRCPALSIIATNFACQRCPNVTGVTSTLTDLECRCATGFIWDNIINRCQRCGTGGIPETNASRATALACSCLGGKVWDVMTNACISPCTDNDSSCMKCADLPGATGASAVALDSTKAFAANTPAGAATVRAAYTTITNYDTISRFMCPCKPGFKWDTARLRCLSQNYL